MHLYDMIDPRGINNRGNAELKARLHSTIYAHHFDIVVH